MTAVEVRLILLVEDDEVFREIMARALRQRGYDVELAGDLDSALASVHRKPPAYGIVDFRLPGRSGLEVISQIHALSPATRLFLLSGSLSEAVRAEAIRRGASGSLRKPLDADEVVAALQDAAQSR